MNTHPHLGLLHEDSIPRELFAEFEKTVRVDGLELEVRARPSGTAYAGMEWLMPTAIVAYIAKPYFESFLKEMGKDHYGLLKEGLKKLYARVAGPKAPKVTLISSAGKVAKEQPYSLFFSIIFEASAQVRFKMLVPHAVAEEEYGVLTAAFLDFIANIHAGTLDEETIAAFENFSNFGGTILVTYDAEKKTIVPVDPRESRRPERGLTPR